MNAFCQKENTMKTYVKPAFCLLTALMLGACASSPPPRLYVYAPGDAWRVASARNAESSEYTIRFAEVRLPAYLDRPNIVTRIADSEIKADAFNRWGMPLDQTVSELLRETIATQVPKAFVDANVASSNHRPGYLVHVNIIRLDGVLGGPIDFITQWQVSRSGAEPEVLSQRFSHFTEASADSSYEAYLDAIHRLMTKLGQEIAVVIENGAARERPAKTE
jgi:uncharacterized lipoprotein YmbA